MQKIEAITVFCGSSSGHHPKALEDASELGTTLAKREITLVYGGAKIGVMGQVAQAALDAAGNVIGVIPEFLKHKEVVHLGLSELITTHDMHERKHKMAELCDAFIALPGGFGTLEELFEVLTWAQLGLHQKPIGLLNSCGFYDPLLSMIQHMVDEGFLKKENLDLLLVDDSISGLLTQFQNHTPQALPKWIKKSRD